MDDALKSLTLYMMIGIVVVIGVSQINRVVGSILGVVFWTAVAIIGTNAYEKGGGIGIPGFVFPQPLFYTICVLFAAVSAMHGVRSYNAKKRAKQARSVRDGED